MRIVIAGPPKAGNVWLKCILSHVYQIAPLGPKTVPDRPTVESFKEWVAEGNFRDETVFHQHFTYSDELADAIDAVPAHIVTIVRDPYDTFVSSYFTKQQYIDSDLRKGRRSDIIMGKPLDHPDVLAFLRDAGFRGNMIKARDWLQSGRTMTIRYEGLHKDPLAELKNVTDTIGSVDDEQILRSMEACSAENMRKMNNTSKHVRAAKVGDSRERLNENHLQIFRETHAELIQSLGYEVR